MSQQILPTYCTPATGQRGAGSEAFGPRSLAVQQKERIRNVRPVRCGKGDHGGEGWREDPFIMWPVDETRRGRGAQKTASLETATLAFRAVSCGALCLFGDFFFSQTCAASL